MKKSSLLLKIGLLRSSLLRIGLILVVCAALVPAADQPKFPPMPGAVSGNAVASLRNGLEIFSLMGIGPRKTWDDVTNQAYMLRLTSGKWNTVRAVPGVAGRLNAVAVGVRGKVFLFGGYVLDAQGGQITVSDVNAYVPTGNKWYRASDMPVAVDSAVIGVNRDRYVYIVGGRSKNGPVNNVQVYDAEKDTWSEATALPGTPVFGHGGGLADDAIVYVDGAAKNPAGAGYVMSQECWIGKINKKDPDKIEWSKLAAHPGPAHFGIAAGASEKDRRIDFTGGSAVQYDVKGLGPDGKAVEVSTVTFDFDVRGNRWETINEETDDTRIGTSGVLDTPVGRVVLGGMTKTGAPTSKVLLLVKR